MTRRLNRMIYPLVAFVALVALACACPGSGGTPTLPPLPTQAPATKPPVVLPSEPPATKPPIGGATESFGGAPFEISSDVYAHSSGAFSTSYPAGWEIEERTDGVFVSEPDGPSSIDVSFTNVGVALDSDSMNNYVQAIEYNWFGSFTDYSQSSLETQQDGSVLVLKTLKTSDGTPYTVFSYYWPVGSVIYEQDFWTTDENYDAYVDGFVEIANTLLTNDAVVAGSPLYEFRFTYTCPNSLCTFDVPYGWAYSQDKTYNNTVVDIFTSPDNQTKVDNLLYDDGTVINKSVAGAFALGLLKEFYAKDIVITDDQVQSDGSERLIWYSKSGGYSGTTFFETRGTSFLMLTWFSYDPYYDLYFPVWGDLLNTYDVP